MQNQGRMKGYPFILSWQNKMIVIIPREKNHSKEIIIKKWTEYNFDNTPPPKKIVNKLRNLRSFCVDLFTMNCMSTKPFGLAASALTLIWIDLTDIIWTYAFVTGNSSLVHNVDFSSLKFFVPVTTIVFFIPDSKFPGFLLLWIIFYLSSDIKVHLGFRGDF